MRAKKNGKRPQSATVITTYSALENLLAAFAKGHISLLVVLGPPGVSKSQSIKRAIAGTAALLIKGRSTPADFYCKVWEYLDCPLILDDADDLFGNKLSKQFIKILTETDEYKRLDYGTTSKVLQVRGAPNYFYTKSPVCIIANAWDSKDSICQAIESRAEMIWFQPDWAEVYRNVSNWFWDQEIFDYVRDLIPNLKTPDMRLFIKAHNRKIAVEAGGVDGLDWREVIDNYVDDEKGLQLRKLLDDPNLKTANQKIKAWESVGGSRATFYRKAKAIETYRVETPQRIQLALKKKPKADRPINPVPVGSDDLDDDDGG